MIQSWAHVQSNQPNYDCISKRADFKQKPFLCKHKQTIRVQYWFFNLLSWQNLSTALFLHTVHFKSTNWLNRFYCFTYIDLTIYIEIASRIHLLTHLDPISFHPLYLYHFVIYHFLIRYESFNLLFFVVDLIYLS